jgi:hypothetical protein
MFPQCSLRIGSAKAAEASASRVRPEAGVVGAPPLKRKDVAHATLASRRESSSWRRAATRSCLSTSSTGFRRWRAKLAAAVKSAARAEREALRQNASRASNTRPAARQRSRARMCAMGTPDTCQSVAALEPARTSPWCEQRAAAMPAVAEREQAEGQKEERQEEHVAAADDEDNHCDR